MFAALVDGLPEVDVERATETIEGGDGNPVTLHIRRPREASGPPTGRPPTPTAGRRDYRAQQKAWMSFRVAQ